MLTASCASEANTLKNYSRTTQGRGKRPSIISPDLAPRLSHPDKSLGRQTRELPKVEVCGRSRKDEPEHSEP